MKTRRQLTLAELKHLLHVVDMDRANGGYYGTRSHYEVRAEQLIVWLLKEIEYREGGRDHG